MKIAEEERGLSIFDLGNFGLTIKWLSRVQLCSLSREQGGLSVLFPGMPSP